MKLALFILGFIAIVTGFFVITNETYVPPIKTPSDAVTTLRDDELREKIGQMIIVGFRGTEITDDSEISKVIKEVKVGGVSLSDFDVPSQSFPRNILNPAQTKKLISDLQKYSSVPLFIAITEEGGSVHRLKEKYGFLPVLSAEKMGQDSTLETTRRESQKLARELSELGFNLNFAPVVDININPQNPIIGAWGRSFSSDAEVVISHARIFIENHLKEGILTVAKHFPGHGSANMDSHLGLPDITRVYKSIELIPYQKLNEEGLLKAVMTAHVMNKNVDTDHPATLSDRFLNNILRKQIGFKGILITDDMQMGAIRERYTFEDAVVRAVNAGNDIILVSNNSPIPYDGAIAYKIRDIIFSAVKENRIEKSRVMESYERILKLKQQLF